METKTLEIQTASVNIQVLCVNNKPMTIAVFKQIQRRDLTERNWWPGLYHTRLIGVVCYPIDGIKRWLVYEKFGDLQRSKIPTFKPGDRTGKNNWPIELLTETDMGLPKLYIAA